MTELHTTDGTRLQVLDRPPRRGGESRVYAARDDEGRLLAVKVALLPTAHAAWLDAERRLLEELAARPETAALVVAVRGHGTWNDRPFFAMDWHERSLATVMEGGSPVADRLVWARRVAKLVVDLQAARPTLLHRDLKPSNLLLAEPDALRLADFGAARELSTGRSTVSMLLYSRGYAPPEQHLPGSRPQAGWDTFGLAATVFACLTGAPPAATTHPVRDVALLPEDLKALRAVVAGPLEATLLTALHPRPEQRTGDAQALLAALERTSVAPRRRDLRRRAVLAGVLIPGALFAVSGLAERAPAYALVPIPAGDTTEPFLLGRVEVSQALWRDVTGEDPSDRRIIDAGGVGAFCRENDGVSLIGDDLPMHCVDWTDAVRFANALSEREGLEPAYVIRPVPGALEVEWREEADGYRLPTAAEWTRAASESLARRDDPAELCRWENLFDRAAVLRWPAGTGIPCDDGFAGPAPVGHFPPDGLGLHDMVGNIGEWTWDPGPEPRTRAADGGGWGSSGIDALDGTGHFSESHRFLTIGVRLARNAP